MRTFLLCLLVSFAGIATAADSTLQYTNYIYEKDIHSVQISQTASGFNFPILNLGTGETLNLEFDQFSSERDYYQFTLIHCNANWEPSGLQKGQALSGTGFDNIDNAMFSTGTLMQYTHYQVTVPGNNTIPRVSGNFLLLVYRNFDENDIVLSRRILVLDNKGTTDVTINQSNQVELRPTHQQVQFAYTLNESGYFLPNPYKDLKSVILRNGEWSTAITDLAPQFVSGNTYTYKYQTGNNVDGLNEYRFFDIRSLRQTGANVKQKFNISNQKHVLLVNDNTRRFDRYMNWKDYNGRYFIYSKDIPLPSGIPVESDYCFVHFTLRSDEELKGKDIYIYGELSDWRTQDDFRMYYNADSKAYEAVVPLKQAYYNYVYAVKDPSTGAMDTRYFEGAHSETENNYMVLMYHRNQTMGFDELIGYGLQNAQAKR